MLPTSPSNLRRLTFVTIDHHPFTWPPAVHDAAYHASLHLVAVVRYTPELDAITGQDYTELAINGEKRLCGVVSCEPAQPGDKVGVISTRPFLPFIPE